MRFAVMGPESRVRGYELAGVLVLVAEDPDTVRALWRDLPSDVAIVVLAPQAAEALRDDALTAGSPLTAVLP